jgi:hypothetical protein
MSGYAPAFGKSLTMVKKEFETSKVCDRSNLGQSLRDFSKKREVKTTSLKANRIHSFTPCIADCCYCEGGSGRIKRAMRRFFLFRR